MVKLKSEIYKVGINPVIDPPHEVLELIFDQAGTSKGPIPVRGKLNGAEFVQTLVKFRGAWRLYTNGLMLKDSGLKVGDVARVYIEFDPRPRDVAVPPKLAERLRLDKKASAAFARLSPSRRKEILRYIGALKTAESIDRNVDRVISQLQDGS